jgi:hypothetical protein
MWRLKVQHHGGSTTMSHLQGRLAPSGPPPVGLSASHDMCRQCLLVEPPITFLTRHCSDLQGDYLQHHHHLLLCSPSQHSGAGGAQQKQQLHLSAHLHCQSGERGTVGGVWHGEAWPTPGGVLA